MSRFVVLLPMFGIAAVRPEKIDAIVANRIDSDGREQYLVLWSGAWEPSRRPGSWHTLHELRNALYKVQTYLDLRSERSRKRKSRDEDEQLPRASPAERRLINGSRSSSVVSNNSDLSEIKSGEGITNVVSYNGVLRRNGDEIIIEPSEKAEVLDTSILPTADMSETSIRSTTKGARKSIRDEFIRRLKTIPGAPVTFVNTRDETTPSLDFTFVNESVLREEVSKLDAGTLAGCSKCRPDMGQNIGCEYTRKCECLEYAEVDPSRLDEDQRVVFDAGLLEDTSGLPKRFPYGSTGKRLGCLVDFYLERRAPIYECNENCRCGLNCKNRCVQHGRKVALEVFKTKNRGFGLKTKKALLRGQFIDTYRGEIITDEEANRREAVAVGSKESYFYSLDKFAEDLEENQAAYVVDGENMGGVTRFINHSCEPNCRQYTVMYNKYDRRVYELAFFAYRDIDEGEELTFDYLDQDDPEDDELKEDKLPGSSQVERQKVECRCGAEKCRKWLWM